LKFGGGVSDTVLNPAVLVVVLIAGILLLIWPRKKACIVFLSAALLIPMDQVLLIAGVHFPMLRVLILFGIARVFKEGVSSKRPLFSGGINKIDIAVILLTVVVAINSIILFQEFGAVVNELGSIYTVFGVYFLLRFLIRDEDDIVRAIRTLAWVAAFVAIIMTFEFTTGRNPYGLLGGANAHFYSQLAVRDDKFRAQAGFGHSILAGTFGAVLVPLFVALWWKGKDHRRIVALGLLSATVITLTSNSSTPMLAYAAGILALSLWPVRAWMRAIRWGIVVILVTLHLAMKAPVWNLIARIDLAGGSSGYHRFMLIDQCIRHFWDWWLIGVKDTSVWGWDMWDTANQYVGLCDGSGLVPFVLFIAILVYGFKYLGRARRQAGKDRVNALFLWAISAALFANVVAFIGISYFDQTIVGWYGLLAIISTAAAAPAKKEWPRTQVLPVPDTEFSGIQTTAQEDIASPVQHGAESLDTDPWRSVRTNTI